MKIPFRKGGAKEVPPHKKLQGPEDRMTLVEHIAEFRVRLVRSLLALVVGGSLVFLFYDPIQRFLIRPYYDVCETRQDFDCTEGFILTDPLQGLATRLRVAMYLGLIIGLPVILWQLWRFITPALHAHEKRYAVPFVASSLVLFGFGAALAWYTWPAALTFLIGFSGSEVVPAFTPDKYVSLVLLMVIAFGTAFEFPVVLVALQLVGVLSYKQLMKVRRFAIVGIVAFAAVITPSGDPISLAAMAVPMVLFYEVSIAIGWVVARNKRKKLAAGGPPPGQINA
jgi:sec-independent protein translocase protein TatC